LHRRSEFGYTDRTQTALPAEPEAVSEQEQARLTLAAQREQERQQHQAWQEARARIVDGVTIVRSSRLPKHIISDVRVIERTVARVDAELRRLG
jgi:hypothetical protein